MNIIMKNKRSFFIELFFSLIITGFAVIIVGKIFWFCDNKLLLNTTDAVPIFTKARYAAECLRNGNWPSWFPNWYCGTSVSQYYPPLTYILLTPLELFLNNTTLCLKIYIFAGLYIGGIGTWFLYRKYIGSFWGITAMILYVWLPYFAISFFYWGTIAQIPIIAIAPWYLIVCIESFKKSKAILWLSIVILTFVLLLSHVMHAFLIALSVFITFLLLNIIKKEKMSPLITWVIGTGLAAGLLSFWWVIGVLPLENPGVPSLAADAAKDVTANFSWFFPSIKNLINHVFPDMGNNIGAYFPFSIILISLSSYYFIRKEKDLKQYVLQFLFIHTIFTSIFAFGSYLPFYKFIPLANQLVPGRILTQTAIGSTILTAYSLSKLLSIVLKYKKSVTSAICVGIVACMVISIIITYKHYPRSSIDNFTFEKNLYSQLDNATSSFDKGRLAWFGDNFSSMNAYFGYVSNYNIISGWNIEGTSTADYLVFQNIALYDKKADYLFKNMNDMNVQTCYINSAAFPWFYDFLKTNGFEQIGSTDSTDIMTKKNESYFLEQIRDCIVIGKASDAFLMDFPWFVKGYSNSPLDYSKEYFQQFNTIYFCEPEIKSVNEINAFNNLVKDLVEQGKHVFIEFGRTIFPAPLLGVSSIGFNLSNKYKIISDDNLNNSVYYTGSDGGYVSVLYGLDKTMYKLRCMTSPSFEQDLIGTKKIDGVHDVVFIGGPITQAREDCLNYFLGRSGTMTDLQKRDEIIIKMFDKIFNNIKMYKNLNLPVFGVNNVNWGSDNCSFSYKAEQMKRMMVSVTYTPRWKVLVDGSEIPTDRIENMVSFNLPAGSHKVRMTYTATIYEKIGIFLTLLSLIGIIIFLILFKKLTDIFEKSNKVFLEYLEIKCEASKYIE